MTTKQKLLRRLAIAVYNDSRVPAEYHDLAAQALGEPSLAHGFWPPGQASTDVSLQEIEATMRRAREIVSRWPLWKQYILEHSLCSQNKNPRAPVNNGGDDE